MKRRILIGDKVVWYILVVIGFFILALGFFSLTIMLTSP